MLSCRQEIVVRRGRRAREMGHNALVRARETDPVRDTVIVRAHGS